LLSEKLRSIRFSDAAFFMVKTSYSKSDFSALLLDYEATYKELNGCTYEDYIEENVMLKREFKNVEEFEDHVSEAEELIFDGTENLTERPKGYNEQKEKYSGKQCTHTNLTLLLSDKKTWIYYVSKYYDGKNVDFGVLEQEFPPEYPWFKNFKILVDLGFIGIDKLYEIKHK
jgi:hypothetical protein